MGKIKEPMVAYKPRKASPRRPLVIGYGASQLRALPPAERSRILFEQAKHAAATYAAGCEEVVGDQVA